ncbi:MAG: N-formylglutamate amidohydrolase [Marinoscillum sp.]
MRKKVLVITCEHASNYIPVPYEQYFIEAHKELNSHLGWDPGAIELANHVAEKLNVELIYYQFTRLLIEVNRSLSHPHLFSKFTKELSAPEHNKLIEGFYLPYRLDVENKIRRLVNLDMQVVHVGVHTFTPEFFGEKRAVEIGILFDPDRANELEFNSKWRDEMMGLSKAYAVRLNEPYAGKDDGFTTYLRSQFDDDAYLGIELEVSQKFTKGDQQLYTLITESLYRTFNDLQPGSFVVRHP